MEKKTKWRDLWPEFNPKSDRILEQLNFRPKIWKKEVKIFLNPPQISAWNLKPPLAELFRNCEAKNCQIGGNFEAADAILFSNFLPKKKRKNLNQIWIFFSLESPANLKISSSDQINWTATFRFDSEIVAPYGKFLKLPTTKVRLLLVKKKEKNGV